MHVFNFSNNNLDEVVFEQRNKAYGAYAIRKAYPNHLNKGIAFTIFPMVLILVGGITINLLKNPLSTPIVSPNPPSISKPIEAIITCGRGFTFMLENAASGFKIVLDKQVKPIVHKKQVVHAIDRPQTGLVQTGIPTLPGPIGLPNGILGGSPTTGGNTGTEASIIGFQAEIMPAFPGGTEAMYAYIQKHLSYPRLALENGVQGKVVVSFVIMPDGKVDMSNLERGIGFGCDEEALRVINNMPTWEPASQNGRKVPVRMILPIVFQSN